MPGADTGPAPGWYLSPAGVPSHADGPSQARAYVDRGYDKIDDDKAAQLVGDGLRLRVQHEDARGTFDDRTARQTVKEEAMLSAKRSAAARKGAETKRRKAAQQDSAGTAEGNSQAG